MWGMQEQEELAIEYNSAYDDDRERWAGEALDAEYEAFCIDMQMWDNEWPLEEMAGNE